MYCRKRTSKKLIGLGCFFLFMLLIPEVYAFEGKSEAMSQAYSSPHLTFEGSSSGLFFQDEIRFGVKPEEDAQKVCGGGQKVMEDFEKKMTKDEDIGETEEEKKEWKTQVRKGLREAMTGFGIVVISNITRAVLHTLLVSC